MDVSQKGYVAENEHKWRLGLKTVLTGIIVSLLMVLVKGAAGILGNSYALVADALESLSDVISSVIVWFGLKYASRPPDDDHPFGHGRAETFVTFVVVGILMLTAAYIIYQSIVNINTPHQLPARFTLIVLGLIILVKEGMYRYVLYRSKSTGSTSLRADAHHHRSDALTSVAAFIGISIALLLGDGYEAADDWAALIAAGVIIVNCYHIFKPAWGEIMDQQNHSELIAEIKKIALQINGVLDTEKCYIRKAGINYLVDLHLEVDGRISVFDGHEIAHRVEDRLKASGLGIIYVSMHVEPRREQNLSDR